MEHQIIHQLGSSLFDESLLNSMSPALSGLPSTPVNKDSLPQAANAVEKTSTLEPDEILTGNATIQLPPVVDSQQQEQQLTQQLVEIANTTNSNVATVGILASTALPSEPLLANVDVPVSTMPQQLVQQSQSFYPLTTPNAPRNDGPLSAVFEEDGLGATSTATLTSEAAVGTSIPSFRSSPAMSHQNIPMNNANTSANRPLNLQPYQSQEQYKCLMDMVMFLATAPTQVWAPDEKMKRMQLPNKEYISCVMWNGLYHITGTDIVRILLFRFEALGRPVKNLKKFEEGVFSDLRNLKPGIDAVLEVPRSPFLELLHKTQCIRTQKKQKVFFWFSVPHDRLFLEALERDLRRESTNQIPTTLSLVPMDPSDALELAKAQCAIMDISQFPNSPPMSYVEQPNRRSVDLSTSDETIADSSSLYIQEMTPKMNMVSLNQGLGMATPSASPAHRFSVPHFQSVYSLNQSPVPQFSQFQSEGNLANYFDVTSMSPAMSQQSLPGNASPALSAISDADSLIHRMAGGLNLNNSPFMPFLMPGSAPGTPPLGGVYQDGNRMKVNRRRAHSISNQPYQRRRSSSTDQMFGMNAAI